MPSVAVRTAPLLLTFFVNRMGTLGLSLLPVLIIDHRLTGLWPPLVMALAKTALMVGVYIGGVASDRIGARWAVSLSFLFEGGGLLALLLVPHWGGWESAVALGLLATIAQLGNAMTPSGSRILLFSLVNTNAERREAQGWLRTANNLGVVVSSSIGWMLTSLGLAGIFILDATTSFAAALLLWFFLRGRLAGVGRASKQGHESENSASSLGRLGAKKWWVPAMQVAGMVGITTLAYQVVETSLAVRFKLEYGALGVSRFSAALLINSSLCALFGILANRWIRRIDRAFALGMVLTLVALFLVSLTPGRPALLYPVMLLLTLGEIVFYALAQFALMSLVPQGAQSGGRYGRLLMVQTGAKWLGASLAFPLAIERNGAGWLALGLSLLGLVAWKHAKGPLRALEADV